MVVVRGIIMIDSLVFLPQSICLLRSSSHISRKVSRLVVGSVESV